MPNELELEVGVRGREDELEFEIRVGGMRTVVFKTGSVKMFGPWAANSALANSTGIGELVTGNGERPVGA